MDIKNITIITRLTPEEHYKTKQGINSLDELISLGIPPEEIEIKKQKTEAQRIFLEEIKKEYGLEDSQFIKEYEIKEKKNQIQGSKLVIAFGGDTTFTLVSHYTGDAPLLGLKGDDASNGGLLYYNRSNFKQAMDAFLRRKQPDEHIEEWPKLQAFINGKEFSQATSQYVISATFSDEFMTKCDIEYKKAKESLECSGIIICTGAGSRGQARSETWYLGDRASPFNPTEKKARWAVVSPFSPYKHWSKKYSLVYGDMELEDELKIISKCKITQKIHEELKLCPGKISADSLQREFFNEGTEIRIYLSSQTLKIVNVPGISYERWQ